MSRIGLILFLAALASPGLAQSPFGRISTSPEAILVDGKPLFLKGVSYSPYIAGDTPGGPIRNVSFRDDILEIRDSLHANAVRVYDPMPEEFYREAKDAGLWVIQGIFIPDTEGAGAVGPRWLLTREFVNAQKERITNIMQGFNNSGLEDVILAYVIGSGLSSESVSRTIKENQNATRFAGVHYSAPAAPSLPPANRYPECQSPTDPFPDPHPFQSFIAELADHLAEMDGRGGPIERHLVGYASVPRNSSFLGARDRPVPSLDLPVDMSFLDVIFENLFSFDHPYILYQGFPSYIDRLKVAYPDKPVVVLETGYSTSPTSFDPPSPLCGFRRSVPQPLHFQFGGLTEADHALSIEARWVDVVTAKRPLAGFFVYEFYDEWWLGGNSETQDDHPGEHFGLKRVVRNGPNVTSTPKAAHAKVGELYGCEGPGLAVPTCGLVIATGPLIEGVFAEPLAIDLVATGGSAPYAWEVHPEDRLPLGVLLDPAGRLEGVPERFGDFRLRLTARDSGAQRERVIVLRIHPPVFSTRGRELLMNGEPFFLEGIDYSPYICGDAPWHASVKADPFTELKEIKEVLGANSIRVYQSLPRTVYDAAREHGLFVIQGIHLQIDAPSPGDREACRNTDYDLLERSRVEGFKSHVLSEIDEIHAAGGSDTILCWVVGNEMSFCAQRKTILDHQDLPRYQGSIYSAPTETRLPCINQYPGCPNLIDAFPDPHPVQSFVAELVDAAAVRELGVYGERRLMAHATDPNTSVAVCSRDRFDPEFHLPVDMGFLDIVFQNVYSYFPPAIRFLGYEEYLEECVLAYPDTPFVILECGYSVSPEEDMPGCAAGPNCGQPQTPKPRSYCFGHNTDAEQAAGLAAQWRSATSQPGLVSGFFVFEYADEWWKGHQGNEFVHEEDKGEEWFGIKAVLGTPEDCQVSNRPAFETVRRMFNDSWCEGASIQCTPGCGSVSIRIEKEGSQDFEDLVLRRNGVEIAALPRGTPEYLDLSPRRGENTYTLSPRAARAECRPVTCTVSVAEGSATFRRGDTNHDGAVDITDAVAELNMLFLGAALTPCRDALDTDDDHEVGITDPIYLLNHLFLGGTPLPSPGIDSCGLDTTDPQSPCCYPVDLCSG